MANTFLAARGVDVGKSLCEHDLVDTANAIFEAADSAGCTIHLPYDVVVAREFAPNPPTRTVNVHEVAPDEMILDVGPAAVEALRSEEHTSELQSLMRISYAVFGLKNKRNIKD